MTLFQRRILTLIFSIIFVIGGAVIIFYAFGYRYNFSQRTVDKVGLLYVTAEPKDSRIRINGQEKTIGNELVLRSLTPGKYGIEIVRDGYFTWSKELEIKEAEATFIVDLTLFKNQDAEAIELFTRPLVLLAEGKNVSLYQVEDTLVTFDSGNRSVTEVQLKSTEPISKADFNRNQNFFVFLQEGLWYYGEIGKEPVSLETRLPADTIKVEVDTTWPLAFTEESVWQINLADNLRSKILDQKSVIDIYSGTKTWFLASDPAKERVFLYVIDEAGSVPRLITTLQYSSQYKIVDELTGFLTVHDNANNILYLIDSNNTEVQTLRGVHTWQWSLDHRQLLTATDFELSVYHLENGIRQELLLRISTPITDLLWHPRESHVLYVTQDKLNIIERDDRDKRNNFVLVDGKSGLNILGMDSKGKDVILTSNPEEIGRIFWSRELTQ